MNERDLQTWRLGQLDGIIALNNQLKLEGKPKIFCPPKGHNFTQDEVAQLTKFVDPIAGEPPKIKGEDGFLIISKLKKMFPCSK